MNLAGELVPGGVGAVIGAAFLKLAEVYLNKRRTPEELAAAVMVAAQAHMGGMRADFDALRDELRLTKDAHAKEIAELKREAAEEKASCDAKLEAVTGQLREAQQQFDSLVRQLRDPASTRPGGVLHASFIELNQGEARVTTPRRLKRKDLGE